MSGPLYVVVWGGYMESIMLLGGSIAPLFMHDIGGGSPLHQAVLWADIALFIMLFGWGVHIMPFCENFALFFMLGMRNRIMPFCGSYCTLFHA